MTVAVVVLATTMALVCEAILLNATMFGDLLQLATDFRFVEEVVVSTDQFLAYRDRHLHEMPDCPHTSPLYACEGVFGEVTSLFLDLGRLRLPQTNTWLYHHWNFRGGPRFEFLEIRNFIGRCGFDWIVEYVFEWARGVRKIRVQNSVLITRDDRDFDAELKSLLNVSELTLTNVSFPSIRLDNTSRPLPKMCNFVDVMLLCPVPRWIWRCFNNATVEPPCWSTSPNVTDRPDGKQIVHIGTRVFSPSPGQTEFSIYTPLVAMCDPPPVQNSSCGLQREDSYRPESGQRGTMTIAFPLLGRGLGVTVTDLYTSNLTTLLEVWDWETESYVVAVNRTAPRDSLFTRTVELLPIPRVVTNRVRITFEYLIPTDSIYGVTLTRSMTRMALPDYVPFRAPCPAPITLNRRRSLDETVADSYCINRLCQFACPAGDDAAARNGTFSFGTPTSAEFVVIEGGVGWPSGELVAQPSDGTRVYRVNGTNITQLVLPGVVGARSVRLVGSGGGGAVDSTVVRIPGQFLKTKRQSISSNLTSTDWRAAGSLPAPFFATNASLAVVNGTKFVYAVTNNTLFRESSSGEWIDTQSSLTDLAVNLSVVMSTGVVRRLVSVYDRFLIVVGANVNERYDGSWGRDLIGRRVVATPIDVLDVVANRWTSALLNHGIECAMDEIDVISLDARRFAVVNRDRTAAVEIAWRPFEYSLVECNTHADCNACLTNVGNIVDCRWCMLDGCTERNAACQRGGATAIDVASCPAPPTTTTTTVSETTMANATSAVIFPSETLIESFSRGASTQPPQATVAEPPASALTGLYVAIGVILGVVAVGVVGYVLWRRRNAQTQQERASDDVAMQDVAPKIASPTTEFDPKARYGDFGDDAEADAPYDVGDFSAQQ
jgi:hypothetical protein